VHRKTFSNGELEQKEDDDKEVAESKEDRERKRQDEMEHTRTGVIPLYDW